MKALLVGLGLTLLGGVALAQSAPDSTPAPAPHAVLPPTGGPLPPSGGSMPPANGQVSPVPKTEAPDTYEGEIIQTPNGTYVVTPHPGEMGGDMGEGAGPGGPEGPGGPPPHPHHPMPPSKAAHIRVKGPDVGLDLKCPDDEPVKACIDAVMPLLDKVAAHH